MVPQLFLWLVRGALQSRIDREADALANNLHRPPKLTEEIGILSPPQIDELGGGGGESRLPIECKRDLDKIQDHPACTMLGHTVANCNKEKGFVWKKKIVADKKETNLGKKSSIAEGTAGAKQKSKD
uniref:Uncharacterized protein n=1 Tax=Cannabis sativa TaxID=3483 RepID=A0A803PRE4_CANSA